ncbi:ParB/RepB/Spo0J family partition protein [Aquincola sp. S2]|uniref:ParB/RepB/Spo0J family partition protein n=1 Tax=Pseudaquabacterium terrae TaxID=2732868 RepID=A0ABX2EUC8_9BURK|nr:ParB/RepB/Spo0J family partition protein [Aquabacterium terrae]NRF72252.1 ParB/RepB/Spo0J family partition protein [Aquabacterium terrae]
MVNETRKKGSGIAFVLPPSRQEAPSPDVEVAAPAEVVERPRGRTGVGLLTASVFESARLEQRIEELTSTVEKLTGERGAQALDPRSIALSRWANRHEDSFQGEVFELFKREIQDAGGNVQPIKVRPLANNAGESPRYEVVFGHRRHRACLELGLPVLAVVQELDDPALFVQMDRENRGRENLSAWEQGRMYLRAMEEGLFSSNTKLAAAIGRDVSDVGKALRAAKLPQEVISAFPSPTSIQFRWIADLERALALHEGKVMAAARELGRLPERPAASEVFDALTACLRNKGVGPSHPPVKVDLGKAGTAQIRSDAKGRTILELPPGALPASRWKDLDVAIRKLLA